MSFPQKNQVRVNHRIRAAEVRVISHTGAQIGVLSTGQALKMASEQGLDLVEVSPEANPPVCRIVDFGKFRYEQAKKHKGEASHSHASKLKELKFRINIGSGDYATRLRHATEFLQKNMRVKISIFFRGRELAHKEYGMQLINRILQDTAACGHTDGEPRLIGKNLNAILVPGKAKPRIPPLAAPSTTPPSPPTPSSEASKPFGTAIKIDLKPETPTAKS